MYLVSYVHHYYEDVWQCRHVSGHVALKFWREQLSEALIGFRGGEAGTGKRG